MQNSHHVGLRRSIRDRRPNDASRRWQGVLGSLALLRCNDILEKHHELKRFSACAASCSNAAAWPRATTLIRQMMVKRIQLDTVAWSSVICAWRAAGWSQALQSLRRGDDSGVQADIVAYNSAMGGAWPLSMSLFMNLDSRGLRRDVYSLSGTIKPSHIAWEFACDILFQHAGAAGLASNAVCVNSFLDILATSSHWEFCLHLLHDAVRVSEGDVITLTSAIQASSNAAHWPQAGNLLQFSLTLRLTDVIMYNAVSGAFSTAGRWKLAHRLLVDDMVRPNIQPDAVTRTSSIRSCKQAAVWEQAFAIHAELASARGLNPQLCSTVLAVCEQAAQWQQSVAFLCEIAGLSSQATDALCLNLALSACDKASISRSAWGLLDACSDLQVKPDVVSHNTALSSLQQASDWQLVVQKLSKMVDRQLLPDAVTCASFIGACDPAHWQNGLSALQQIERWHVQADVVLVNSAISAVEKILLWQQALALGEEMDRLGIRRDEFSVCAMASACATATWKHSLRVLDQMEALTVRDDRMAGRVFACNAAMSSLERASLWRHSTSLLKSALECGLAADSITYNTVVRSYRWARAWQRACDLLMDSTYSRVPPSAVMCSDAVAACEEVRRWGAVGQVLARIEKRSAELCLLLRQKNVQIQRSAIYT